MTFDLFVLPNKIVRFGLNASLKLSGYSAMDDRIGARWDLLYAFAGERSSLALAGFCLGYSKSRLGQEQLASPKPKISTQTEQSDPHALYTQAIREVFDREKTVERLVFFEKILSKIAYGDPLDARIFLETLEDIVRMMRLGQSAALQLAIWEGERAGTLVRTELANAVNITSESIDIDEGLRAGHTVGTTHRQFLELIDTLRQSTL